MRLALPVAALAALALLGACRKPGRAGYASNTRTAIRTVGAPELFGRNVAVSNAFTAANPSLPAPVIEIMPDAQAMALLCRAPDLTAPDAATLLQPPSPERLAACRARGVEIAVTPLAPVGPASHPVLVVSRAHLGRLSGLSRLLRFYAEPSTSAETRAHRH